RRTNSPSGIWQRERRWKMRGLCPDTHGLATSLKFENDILRKKLSKHIRPLFPALGVGAGGRHRPGTAPDGGLGAAAGAQLRAGHRRDPNKLPCVRRSDIHEEASVKTKEQDEHGTTQTSIRHPPRKRSAMRRYAVAPIHTSGVALRHVGPRDATSVPLSILTGPLLNPDLVTS